MALNSLLTDSRHRRRTRYACLMFVQSLSKDDGSRVQVRSLLPAAIQRRASGLPTAFVFVRWFGADPR